MEKTRNLTCIVCPRGCALAVTLDSSGEVKEVTGNACKRGADYAKEECVRPMRCVTSTVACLGGGVVSVRCERAVPKAQIFDVMAEINKVILDRSVTVGDIIIENVCGTGVNVIATACKEILA